MTTNKKIVAAALKTAGHYVDMAAFRLYVTPAFEKKASYYGTLECDTMNAILDAFPNMVVEIVKSNRKNNTITYAMMENFIRIMPDAAANLAEFDRVKKMSHAYRSAYQFVADWFEKKFPHYGELLVTDEKGNPVWDAVAMCQKAEEQAAAKPVEAAADKPKLVLMKNA